MAESEVLDVLAIRLHIRSHCDGAATHAVLAMLRVVAYERLVEGDLVGTVSLAVDIGVDVIERARYEQLLVSMADRGHAFGQLPSDLPRVAFGLHNEVAQPLFRRARLHQSTLQLLLESLECTIAFFAAELKHFLEVLLRLAEDGVQTADGLLENIDPTFEDIENPLLDRACDPEVENLNRIGLTDSVDAADTLLNAHRVPWEVVVDEQVAKLKITSLTAGLGAQEDAGFC